MCHFLTYFALTLFFIFSAGHRREMSGHVVGGEFTTIGNYPHYVYLRISSNGVFSCGGSILNQNLVLTAAHCFEEYQGRQKDYALIKYGASKKKDMSETLMRYFKVHENYDERTLFGDIALVRSVAQFRLGKLTQRVAIMETAPRADVAYVSGFGAISYGDPIVVPDQIKHTSQTMQSWETCDRYLKFPAGVFCAGPVQGTGHPAVGDSGGALIIYGFIQIGIVSFKAQTSLVAYTNTSYFYNWIQTNSAKLYCAP